MYRNPPLKPRSRAKMRFLDAGILIVGFLNTSKTNSTLECPKESRSVNVCAFLICLAIFYRKENSFYQTRRADMEFVKNFTHPDFQAKSFTPQKCVICDSFFTN